jgi:hypothetical protein
MSLLSQIPKPSFIFDPSQANESRDALTQVRRIADQSGGGFTRASTKYVVNKAGVLVEVPANIPAVEFDGAFNKGYKAEPSATNLVLRSEELDAAAWSPTDTTVTPNAVISPKGVQDADIVSIGGAASRVAQNLSLGAGTYTASVWVRSISSDVGVRLVLVVDGSNVFDNIVVNDQWQRIKITVTASTGITAIQLRGSLAGGSPTGDVAFWGAQLETGSVATSYIPTVASTATRSADSLVFTGAQDLIGQSSGVILMDFIKGFEANGFDQFFSLEASTSSNRINFRLEPSGSNNFRVSFRVGGVDENSTITGFPISSKIRILVDYISGDRLNIYINGSPFLTNVSIGTWASVISNIAIGNGVGTGATLSNRIKSAYLWNNADWITDELAQTLTRI